MFKVLIDILKQYGFGAAMAVFVAFILYYVLKWVKENQNKILDQAVKREEDQRKIIVAQIKELKAQRNQARKYHRKEMADHEQISKGLGEICQTLGRINGYKENK